MSSNLSKEFFELIKAIGESKSKQEEDRIIQDEVRVLKQLVTDSKSTRRMKEVMVRLIYVEMLGHDASWGYVVAAQQTATPDLLQKRAGYLACSLMLSPDHEFRFMLVNQMQRDLASPNVLEACAALVACCKLVTLEMIPALLQRVADLLPHDQTLIRKKSVMALHRFYQLDPNSIAHLTDSIKSLLRDRDPAVMGAALCLLHDMARADPPSQADLVDQYVSILKQITEHRLPRDYDYHRMPAPWIQIKLLQILSTLGANDKKASECMYEVLGECMKRADTGTNIGYAVVYETVKTVTTIWPDPTLLDNAANAISRFLTSEAYNLKYLGVTGLAAIVRDHPKYALQHQMAVIDCLEDPDETLKRKTLELLFRMTNPGNAEAVVDKLLHFLEQAIDPFLRSDLVTRIVELADRYAPSNLWFVETMVKVIKVAGDLVDSDACQNLLRLFAEGVEQNDDDPDETENENAEMRRTGCSLLLEAVRKPHSSETLLKCAFWVLGEYGYLLSTQPQNGHSKSKRPQEEDDDVLRVEDDEESVEEEFEIVPLESVLTAICDAVERTTLVNHSTKAYGISAIAKISAQLGVVTPLARDTIRKHSSSRHTELQRRCREFQLVSKDMNRTRILFPVDASCEDFDNVDFSFLDEFTDILRAAGANEYQENLRVTNDYDFGETLASAPQQSQATKPTLKFDAYEAPKIFEPTPVATTTTTPSTSDISADDLMKMVANSSISTPPVPIPPPKPNVKSLWGPQGYMGTLPVIGGSIPQSSNNVQSYSPTPTTPTPATVTGVATISPDYDFGASAAEEQTSMEDLRPPPPPVKKELSEKEKAAQALFGGLGGSKSSGSKTKGASASSSTTRPAPVSQQQPQTKKPPAPPKQDLFSMDGDLLGVGDSVSTPVSTPTPAANNSLLDLFSSPSAPMTPPFVPVVSKALLNPSVMNTAQFGSLWPSHSAEARLSVPLTRPSFSEFIQSFAGKTQVHLVEYIPATMEAIFAGEASDRSIALIHAKLNGPTVDLMVRTQKPDLTGKVVDALGRLEYDTGAISLAGLIPFTITTIRLAFNVFLKPNEVVSPRVTKVSNPYGHWVERLYKNKTQTIKQRKEESTSYASKRLAFLALGWAFVVAQLLFREAGADIQKFDPFEILGISQGATEIEVKKAYKKLSLVHHPDRWATADKAAKALAETRFVMVAKAYEALTDPTARENFQKYGNPDGRQALEMSIGLPSWLLEKDNQTWVIASYLLLSVIVFPASVVLLTMNAAKSSSSGSEPKKIFPDTEELFRVAIRNGLEFRATMELFSLAAEFRQLTYRSNEEKNFVLELRQQLVREEKFPIVPSPLILSLIKVHPFIKGDGNEKAQVLVYIHMYRLHERLNDELKEDLDLLLSFSPQICKAMIMHARVTCNHNNLLPIIVFQQHLNQAMIPGNYMLLQLPNILNNDIEDFTVQTLLKLNKDPLNQRDQLMLSCWENFNSKERKPLFDDPEKERDCEAVLKLLPYRELSFKIGTIKSEHSKKSLGKSKNPRDIEYEFEPETIQGDLVHVIATLKSTNPFRKPTTPKATIAYTPFLPHEVKEEWYLILIGGPNPKGFNNIVSGQFKIASFAIVDDDSELELVADLMFLTANHNNDWMGSADWPIGTTKLMLIAMPSCYVDMNRTCQLDLKLIDPSKSKTYKHHEEDERLDLEPTSIYAMMQQQTEYEVDSDFGDGEIAEEEDE